MKTPTTGTPTTGTPTNPTEIEKLEKLVKYHNIKYFVDNNPEISDEEFDILTEQLRKLKPDSAVLYELVGEIGDIKHTTPMLSLEKKYTYEDIKKWVTDINDENYIVEPKYDGMAARYQNNTLSTRGDGFYGENISERLKYLTVIGNLPSDPNVSAHGEIVITLSYFRENLEGTYKNPRNAVVGIIKSKQVKPEGIKAIRDGMIHFVLYDQSTVIQVKQKDLLNETTWEEILEQMFQIDYALDGIVIKATSENIKNSLFATQHHEKWQIAYKSPAERKETVVVGITDQVGRTGRITSVAQVKPIVLSGATVTNVTLHNIEFIEKTGIDIGDKVEICRSGEVIPFITQVFPADLPQNKRTYKIPTNCPVCASKLIRNNKYLECPNPDCAARKAQSYEYFFKVLNAEELGIKTIETLINAFKIDSIIDFYELKDSEIAKLDRLGEKSAKKIVSNIRNTLNGTITPTQLLQALGIREIGPATSMWIINHFGFENLHKLTAEDIATVKGIGPVKAKYFIEDLRKRWPLVEELLKLGLQFEEVSKSTKLNGKSFAITGKKEKYSRDELIKMINDNGGTYKTSITKDLSYLIAGEDAGSKAEKAGKLGVEIISETQFLKLI